MAMKVIDTIWFNSVAGTFGFVLGENERGERKLYAGLVSGRSEEHDQQTVLDWGAKVNIGMMEGLLAKAKGKG